jgi:hypothetical protein
MVARGFNPWFARTIQLLERSVERTIRASYRSHSKKDGDSIQGLKPLATIARPPGDQPEILRCAQNDNKRRMTPKEARTYRARASVKPAHAARGKVIFFFRASSVYHPTPR